MVVRRRFALLAMALVLTLAATAAAKQTVIDSFDGASSTASWVFSNGPEFPGAKGSLTSGPGDVGVGASLAYDFTAGGAYVSMTLRLPTPIRATAIGYSARAVGVRTVLRVIDSGGQTFQYEVNRPLEAGGPTAWYDEVVDLTAPTLTFGGPNDGVLRQPIIAVSLLAGNALQRGLAGTAAFDSVVAWDARPASLDPAQSPSPAPPGAGDLASRLGVNIHFTSDDRALDIIAAAGFTRVRMDLDWASVENKKGVYDFSSFDALLSALVARGIKLHLILDYFNSLYPSASDPAYATTTIPAFAAVSKAAAVHFVGQGLTYEVWNEENIATFWPPTPSPAQYAPLCSAAIAAVHAGDPSALVATGGLSGFDDPFLEAMLDGGAAVGANAVGIHPYRPGGGESVSDDLAFMRSIVASAVPASPPIWDTEWGYSSQWYGDAGGHDPAARAIQAQRTSRELLSAWALGFPMAIDYDIRDDGTDPANAEHNFGLVQNDYTDKPAVVGVRTLTHAARGRVFTGFLPVGFTSLHAMLLVGAVDRVVALWSDAPGSVTSVTVPSGATAVDMFGAPLSVANDGGVSSITVREAAGPVFLTFPNPAGPNDGGQDGSALASDGSPGQGGGGTPADAAAGAMDASVAFADASVAIADAGPGVGSSASRSSPGCGCRTAGHQRARPSPFALALAGVLWSYMALVRRRRLAGWNALAPSVHARILADCVQPRRSPPR